MVRRPGGTVIGMGSIKQRRLGLPVSCHAGLNVGRLRSVLFLFTLDYAVCYPLREPSRACLSGRPAADRPSGGRSAPGRAMGGGERAALGVLAVERGGVLHSVPRAAGSVGARSTGTPSRRPIFARRTSRKASRPSFSSRICSLGIWSSASACIPRPSCRACRTPCRAPRIGRRSKSGETGTTEGRWR